MPSKTEIKECIKNENIKTIFLQFIDINGGIKSLQVPSNRIDEILDNEIMFDGSTISGFRDNETLDLRLYPDKSTFLVFPFKITKLKNTARLICDIYNSDGTPFAGCPRSNLKRVIEREFLYTSYSVNPFVITPSPFIQTNLCMGAVFVLASIPRFWGRCSRIL